MSADSEKFIPTKEAASLVGRTSDYVGRLAREGKIPASRIGRSWVVSRKALLEYFDIQESVKEIKKEKLSQTRKEEYKEVQKPKVSVEKSLTIFIQKLPVENLVSFAVAVFVVFGSFSLVNASGLAKFPKVALDVIHDKAVSLNRGITSATSGPRPAYLGNYVVEKNASRAKEFEVNNVFALALDGFESVGENFEYQRVSKKNDYVVEGGDGLSLAAVWDNYVALGEGIVETSHVLSQAYVDLVHALGKGTLQNALAARDLSRALHRNTFAAYESGVNIYVSSLQAAPDAYTGAVYAFVDQSHKITKTLAKTPLQVGNAILSSSQSIPEGNQKIGSGLRVIMPALGEAIVNSHERFVYGFVESSYAVVDAYKDSIVRTGDHVGGAYASARFDLPPKVGESIASAFIATTDAVDESIEHAGEYIAQAYIVPVVTVALSGVESVQYDVEDFSKNLASGTVAKKNLFEDAAESAQANVVEGVQNFFARLFGRGEDPVLLVNPGPAQTNIVIKEDEPAVITPGNVVQNFFATTDVNKNYVDASISSLHAALSSEIQKLTSLNRNQIIQNIQTTHVLNRIEDLTDTILRTPEIIGGTLDDVDIRGSSNFSGNTVSGNEFIGGTANFGTTTVSEINVTNNITAGGVLSVAGLTSNGVLTGPYFTATSTTATSTFAGSIAIDTDGFVYATSTRNVGIGVLSPNALLSLQNSTSTQPIATFANDSGSELFRFTNTGYLGIGTTSPYEALSVDGNGVFTGTLTAGATTLSGALVGTTAEFTSGTTTNATSTNFFATNGRFTNLIGTNATITAATTTSFYTSIFNAATAALTNLVTTNATSTNFAISSLTSGRVPYITTGGRFTDSSALTFDGTTLTGTDLVFTRATTTNATSTNLSVSSTFNAVTGGAQAAGITVNTDGYVGINNTSPLFPLDVTVSATKPAVFRGTTEPRVRFVANGSNVGLLNGYVGDSFRVYSSSGLPLHIGANESTQLRFTTTEINVSDDLIPTANATYDLGSPSFYWDDAYLDSLTVNNLSAASTSIAGTNNASFSINSDNATSDGEDSSLVFYRGVVVPNAVISWDASEDNFNFNQNIFIQNANGGIATSTVTVRAASGQTGNLFTVQDVNGLELANFGANGYLGLGSSSPSVRLTVGTGTPNSIASGNYYNSAYVSGDLEVDGTIYGTVSGAVTPAGFTEGSVVFAGSGGTLTQDNSNFFWNDTTNSLGIGTATPTQKLSVWGDVEIGDASGNNSLYAYNADRSSYGQLDLYDGANGNVTLTTTFGSGDIIFTPGATGGVGIGTTTPDTKLTVTASGANGLNLDTDTSNSTLSSRLFLSNATAGQAVSLYNAAGALTFNTGATAGSSSGTERVRINSNGYVGIGTTSPDYSLDVDGDFRVGEEGGSVRALLVDATNGRVGIGHTSNPSFELDVVGTTRIGQDEDLTPDSTGLVGQLLFDGNGYNAVVALDAAGLYFGHNSAARKLFLQTNETNRLTIDGSGNVGIGEDSPANVFHITNTNPTIRLEDSDSAATIYSQLQGNGQGDLVFKADPGAASGSTQISFELDGAEVGRFNTGGNFGIGTTTPAGKLSVTGGGTSNGLALAIANSSNGALLTIQDDGDTVFGPGIATIGTAQYQFSAADNTNAVAFTDNSGNFRHVFGTDANTDPFWRSSNGTDLNFGIDSTNVVTIASTTNQYHVGISTSTPWGKFSVVNTYATPSFVVADQAADTTPFLIDASGNVGIGTSTPQGRLHVVNASSDAAPNGNADDIVIQHTGNSGLSILSGDSNEGNIYFGDTSSNLQGAIKYSHADSLLSLYSGGGRRLSIDSSGNVGIGTSTPGYLLDVDGDFRVGEAGNSDAFFVNATNGNVGINTASPGNRLSIALPDVDDGISFTRTGWGTASGFFLDDDTFGENGLVIMGPSARDVSVGIAGNDTTDGFNVYTDPDNTGGADTFAFGVFNNGNVGIGEAVPDSLLHITGNDPTITLEDNAGSPTGTWSLRNTDDTFRLRDVTTGADRITVDASGNVGIGTTSPQGLLHVTGPGGFSGTLPYAFADELIVETNSTTGISLLGGDANNQQVVFGSASDNFASVVAWNHDDDLFTIQTRNTGGEISLGTDNGVEAVRIDNSGNVGIGTSTPDYKLHVFQGESGATAGAFNGDDFVIEGSGSTGASILVPDGAFFAGLNFGDASDGTEAGLSYSSASDDLSFIADGSARASLSDTQFYVFGATGAQYRLTDGSGSDLRLAADGGDGWVGNTNSGSFAIRTNNLERVTVSASGNVGIGTTTPSQKLSVGGDASNTYLQVSNTGTASSAGLFQNSSTGYGESDGLYVGYSDKPYIWNYENTDITFATNNTVRAVIDNSGNVGIGTTSPYAVLSVTGDNDASYLSYTDGELNVVGAVGAINVRDYTNENAVFSVGNSNAEWQFGTTNSNFFRIRDQQNGENRFFIDSGAGRQNAYFVDVNLGIGTTSPYALLSVSDNLTNGTFNILQSFSGETIFLPTAGSAMVTRYGNNSTDYAGFGAYGNGTEAGAAIWSGSSVSGSPEFFIDATGNVGIGTSTPEGTAFPSGYDITNANTNTLVIQSDSTTGDTGIFLRRSDDATGLNIWQNSGNGDTSIESMWSTGDIHFKTQAASSPRDALTIAYNGNVGIGDTTPNNPLEINTTNKLGATFTGTANGEGLRVTQTDYSSGNYVSLVEGAYDDSNAQANVRIGAMYDGGGSNLAFGTSNAYGAGITNQALWIDSSGWVGVGTTTEKAPFSVGSGSISVGDSYRSTAHIQNDNYEAVLTLRGGETGYLNAALNLIATDGSNTRALGAHAYDEGSLRGWFWGRPYSSSDAFAINRRSTTGFSTDIADTNDADVDNLFYINSSGNVGINTNNPSSAKLVVNNDSDGSNAFIFTVGGNTRLVAASASSGSHALLYSGNSVDLRLGVNSSPDDLVIKNGGNIGLSTTTPDVKLSIAHSGATADVFKISDNTGRPTFVVDSSGVTSVREYGLVKKSALFNIFGSALIESFNPNLTFYDQSAGGDDSWQLEVNGGALTFYSDVNNDDTYDDTLFVLQSNSYAKVGTSALADGNIFRLEDANGLCQLNPGSGSLATSCSSDERLKSDIVDAQEGGLSYISDFRIRDYTVNADGSKLTGVIAQEVLAVRPDMVTLGDNGFYLVEQPNIWKLVQALQELDIRTAGISTDASGNVGIGTSTPQYKLHVLGDAAATSFVNISTREEKKGIAYLDEARKEDILEKLKEVQIAEYRYNYEDDNNPLRLGLIAEEAPSEILSVSGKGVDIYKLATFTLASVQELATRVESLEERVAALEAQGVIPGQGGVFSTSTLQSALSELGVLIEKGFAQFDKLAFRQLIAEKDNDGQGAAGTGTVRLGDKLVLVENKQIKASSKVFVTFTSPVVGSWFITDKANGSFRVTLDQVQTSDVTFDYFIVQTEREAVPTSDTGVVDTEAPVVEVLGANPYYVITGNTFTDPGVIITDNVDQNLEYELFVDGYPAVERPLNTSVAGEHVLTYKVLDTAGNLTTATRAVVVGSGAGLGSTDTGTTTPATTGDTGTSTPPVVEEEEVVEETPADEIAPVITLTGKAALKVTVGDTFVDAGATATDDVDGDLTADIVVSGSVDTDAAGLYTLTYTVADAAGNEASVSRIVTVEAPVEEVEEEVTEEVVE